MLKLGGAAATMLLMKFDAEEARRFELLEDHWDVLIADYPG